MAKEKDALLAVAAPPEVQISQGRRLFEAGEWSRAEGELHAALEASRGRPERLRVRALAALAELRLAQGRLDDAERLVEVFDAPAVTATVWARIHLLRGRPALAAAAAGRGLAITRDHSESAALVELVGESETVRGRYRSATRWGDDLVRLGEELGSRIMTARGLRLRGRALAAGGQDSDASPHLDGALTTFLALAMPLEAARTRLLRAEALIGIEPDVAVAEGREALVAFEQLGARLDVDAATTFLHGVAARTAYAVSRGYAALTKREREVLSLLPEGLSNPAIAERLLLSPKTVEHHVASVLAKLGVASRGEAAAVFLRPDGPDALRPG